MKCNNFEKKFIDIICPCILAALVFIISLAMGLNLHRTYASSNSEYNGTIYSGDKTSKKISLMVNVYWGNEFLEQMLDTFKQNDIKTTFFVGGSWAKDNPELLKRIYNEGHEIGSHGYSHKEQGKLDFESNYKEIKSCHDMVKSILNLDMELFAPPSGSYNKNTVSAASELGYKTIMWTRDTIDWRDKNTELIYSRAVSNLSGGDLILMHPTANTAEALSRIIAKAKSLGYSITTVSDVLALKL